MCHWKHTFICLSDNLLRHFVLAVCHFERANAIVRDSMTHTTTVALPPAEVLARLKMFFAERVPHASAFVEREGPTFALLRGQGGEELAFAAVAGDNGTTRVRASTLFFDQALDRFFATLPLTGTIDIK